ncbi:phospholipase D-like domain-containing protein [Sphingomonas sp. Xoc002]|uniref:phospholipase D-like domain-containing protein n=1 Tax=Sphingomonas sp. Xoc002 TaxID=2837624 RepID=UPI003D175A1F
MKLVLGGINGTYLRNFIEQASQPVDGKLQTEAVWAAVAYATDTGLLFDWCWDKGVPLRFWGRLDDEVAVTVGVLNSFLSRRSPNFVCKLVQHHHAKVIWWRGFGVYIGSANLTSKAWYKNVEAGCFFPEAEIDDELDRQISDLFAQLDAQATPLTEELRDWMIARAKKLAATKSDPSPFWQHPSIKQWSGLVRTAPKAASDRQRQAFLNEWRSTLQTLRDIGATVSQIGNRPAWVNPEAAAGAQADQFLHAHYYMRTFDGRRADFERYYEQFRLNPAKGLNEAVEWWKASAELEQEAIAINETAPRLRDALRPESLARMTLSEFREVAGHIHAMREYSRRVANRTVGLPSTGTQYSIPEKLDALTKHIWTSRTASGASVTEVIQHILYGGPIDLLPDRLWDAISEPSWKLDCMGVSAYGELVGWAMPDRFPPRNGRTSKALRSLGYDVRVHVG